MFAKYSLNVSRDLPTKLSIKPKTAIKFFKNLILI